MAQKKKKKKKAKKLQLNIKVLDKNSAPGVFSMRAMGSAAPTEEPA